MESANGSGSPVSPSFGALPASGGSFTALLGMPADQAMELLHRGPDSTAVVSSGKKWRLRLPLPPGGSPRTLFPFDARFPAFPKEDSPVASSPAPRTKAESSAKRKEREESKEKAPAKRNKRRAEEGSVGDEKHPYVHVRARRGQATDSHSLAERARREKINARMKVLRELVPGCSKISGTTLVLDEIINHVRSLQRLIELLSMRLAAVDARISFSRPVSFSSVECGNERSRMVGLESMERSSHGGSSSISGTSIWCAFNKHQEYQKGKMLIPTPSTMEPHSIATNFLL